MPAIYVGISDFIVAYQSTLNSTVFSSSVLVPSNATCVPVNVIELILQYFSVLLSNAAK